MNEAFFTLHNDLPREGPGEPSDVAWAAKILELSATAKIADVACGTGGDIGALLDAAPKGDVTALDKMAHFIATARERWRDDPRVTLLKADMAVVANEYDLIWCAGAVYFMGVENALRAWKKSLLPGGAIAFSEVCWFGDARPERVKNLFADYPAMTDAAGITAQVQAAGYEVVGQRRLGDAAWESYFQPMEQRIAALRPSADAELKAVLDEAQEEISCWRAHRDAFGYLLSVVRPAR